MNERNKQEKGKNVRSTSASLAQVKRTYSSSTSGSSKSLRLRPGSEFNKSLTFSLQISSPEILIVKSLSGVWIYTNTKINLKTTQPSLSATNHIIETEFKKPIFLFYQDCNISYIHYMVIDVINSFLCYSSHGICLPTASLPICKYGSCNNPKST